MCIISLTMGNIWSLLFIHFVCAQDIQKLWLYYDQMFWLNDLLAKNITIRFWTPPPNGRAPQSYFWRAYHLSYCVL